jgi:hypothetical protein
VGKRKFAYISVADVGATNNSAINPDKTQTMIRDAIAKKICMCRENIEPEIDELRKELAHEKRQRELAEAKYKMLLVSSTKRIADAESNVSDLTKELNDYKLKYEKDEDVVLETLLPTTHIDIPLLPYPWQ